MRIFNLVIVCCALFVGCSSVRTTEAPTSGSKTVDLGGATIQVPNDFIHFQGQGIDSEVGDFTRTDGLFRINYDIGMMAGVYTSQPRPYTISSNSATVGTLTAITVVAVVSNRSNNTRYAAVSFPATEANFFARIRDDSELEALKKLVSTYKLNDSDHAK